MGRCYKNKDGYVMVSGMHGHKKANSSGAVPAHTLNAEKKIGRSLRANEVVHHKNRNKADNSSSNLRVMTRSAHSKLHKKYD